MPNLRVVSWSEWIQTGREHLGVDAEHLGGLVHLENDNGSAYLDRFWVCAEFSYARLLRRTIHEAAHVIQYYKNARATGNQYEQTKTRMHKSAHGRDFRRVDSLLLHRAKELGLRKRWFVPADVADLFD